MKVYTRKIVLFLFAILGMNQVSLSNLTAFNIQYQAIGQDSFMFYITLHRKCDGISAPPKVEISFVGDCGISFKDSLLQVGYASNLWNCPNTNTCNGGSLPGIEEYFYSKLVVLPTPCNRWEVSFTNCCRDTSNNLVGNQNAYISTKIFRDIDANNNSPVSNSLHYIFVCKDQIVNYNLGITTPDQDSITIAFVTPKTDSNSAVQFLPGFTFSQPIPGINLNSATSQLTFFPTNLGRYYMSVKISEYDKLSGQLKGWQIQELIMYVIDCSNAQPTPQGITNLQGNATLISADSIHVNLGDSFSFDIEVTDADTADSVTIFTQASAVLPGATITRQNGNPAKLSIAWRAPSSPNNTRVIHISAVDDVCATPGIGIRNYTMIIGTGINSVNTISKNLGIKIYPNPVQETLQIDLRENTSATIEIISITGERMFITQTTSNHLSINVSNFSTGVYVVKTTTQNGNEFKRFVKN